ncbi:winged helix-turn-helix transcriptional regulator [Treponema sp. J25]|uniref:winged helix-turn-helix transcriptional regulator n=1 Tax=Treponema sp. J25 TaxID=2094121 RepID=UPI0010509386|nr:winged helix-turn-helix transcriptional regulator [Treponema sp. J25]TCW60740.1 transcriptional regulator [Treponema sp. J25]
MPTEHFDEELVILENIYDSARKEQEIRQRDLAHVAGVSLGMANAILKRMAQKGWITIRRVNSRNIHYAITPEGLHEIARRSYRYVKRTIKNVVIYRDLLDRIILSAKLQGYSGVILVGISDFEFIIEHVCLRHEFPFFKAIEVSQIEQLVTKGLFVIYSENIAPSHLSSNPEQTDASAIVYLSALLEEPLPAPSEIER